VMHAFGLSEPFRKVAFLPEAIMGRNYQTARQAFRTPLKGSCPALYGADFCHVHRSDLHDTLALNVPEGTIELAKPAVSVINHGETAVARFADGSEYEADLIVGADGVRSVVRNEIFGEAAAQYTGNMCWRALVPVDKFPLPHVSPDSSVWLGPKGHIVTYYVKGGAAVNIVAVLESKDWVEESWTAPSDTDELVRAYAGWHPNIVKLLEQTRGTGSVFKWGLFDRDPMSSWTRGRITLLGDAAHPMLPFLSQGAAMSIEDAYVLAASLAHHGNDMASALSAYEAERKPRTARVQLESRERGRTYHLPTAWSQFQRDVKYWWKGLFNPHASGLQASWVYSYNATDFDPVARAARPADATVPA
jgi:salicylate hydroxylase